MISAYAYDAPAAPISNIFFDTAVLPESLARQLQTIANVFKNPEISTDRFFEAVDKLFKINSAISEKYEFFKEQITSLFSTAIEKVERMGNPYWYEEFLRKLKRRGYAQTIKPAPSIS